MNAYARSLSLFLLLFATLLALLVILAGINRPLPGDEPRFIQTAQQFGERFSLDLLRHYEEMSTPLPFLWYGAWGRWFGYELPAMRLGSLFIALLIGTAVHHLLWLSIPQTAGRWLAGATVALNPYFLALSLFVYTDMLALLFVILALTAVLRRRPVLLAIAMAAALLCRQYMIYAWLAVMVYLWLTRRMLGTRSTLGLGLACMLSLLPLIVLCGFWGGLSPDNTSKHLYLDDPVGFHPSSLTLYIGLTALYLIPMLAYRWRNFWRPGLALVILLPAIAWYALFPIGPSPSAVRADIWTVGLFHRLLRLTHLGEWFEHLVFIGLLIPGLVLLLMLVRRLGALLRQTGPKPDAIPAGAHYDHAALLMTLNLLAFLAVMPWSYLLWEKYYLPVLPAAAIAVWQLGSTRLQGLTKGNKAPPGSLAA